MEKETKSVEAVETVENKEAEVVEASTQAPVEEVAVEEVPAEEAKPEEKKKNPVKEYLSGVWFDFIDSFRYNHCKLPGILIALPGLFIGFFLVFHSKIQFLGDLAQLSGFYMFILVLFGCINIFNGVTVSSKKNMSSIVISAICSLVIVVFGALWIFSIFYSYIYAQTQKLDKPYVLNINHYMSIVCVVLSILCSVVGCVLAYLNRDKNYKKVKF